MKVIFHIAINQLENIKIFTLRAAKYKKFY